MESVPFTIIGGGVCGGLAALKLKEKYPDREVILLEKESYFGHHSTTRNSGVLHAGIYYPQGSLKHRLCMAGYKQWIEYAHHLTIPINICGKYVIAKGEGELQRLQEYFLNAKRNGVPHVRKMTSDDFKEIHEYTNAVDGFHSPSTAVMDVSSCSQILHKKLESSGIIILLNCEALNLKSEKQKMIVETNRDTFLTENLINCAGAGAVGLRKKLGLLDIENKFVKGNYVKLQKPYYNKKLLYPVPLKNLTGLGVHTSFQTDGVVRFGPNTELIDEVDYINHEQNLQLMFTAIQSLFKGIRLEDLSLDYSGVRTKIIRKGQLYPDFLLQGPKDTGRPGYMEALGIESPGLTAAPAIADTLISLLDEQ